MSSDQTGQDIKLQNRNIDRQTNITRTIIVQAIVIQINVGDINPSEQPVVRSKQLNWKGLLLVEAHKSAIY